MCNGLDKREQIVATVLEPLRRAIARSPAPVCAPNSLPLASIVNQGNAVPTRLDDAASWKCVEINPNTVPVTGPLAELMSRAFFIEKNLLGRLPGENLTGQDASSTITRPDLLKRCSAGRTVVTRAAKNERNGAAKPPLYLDAVVEPRRGRANCILAYPLWVIAVTAFSRTWRRSSTLVRVGLRRLIPTSLSTVMAE